jgi:glycosyltransferase involved in cell wall biosynthesis
MEGTPHVVLEAIGNNLPIICFDICGMSAVVDNSVGIKIPLSNVKRSVKDFAKAIATLYSDRKLLQALSNACVGRQHELSWDNKARKMVEIYKKIK